MIFGNPSFLWALPLALAPILLHLFYRRKKRTVEFSTLLFFTRKEKHLAYRRRLREILILILRTLILLLVILGLSRPFFQRFTFVKGGGTEAVLILDDTMSMQRTLPGGTDAFEQAKKQAEYLMNALSAGDGAGLVLLSGKPGIAPTRERGKIIQAIRTAELTGAAGSYKNALAAAMEYLRKAPGVNREIYLISDFQTSAAPMRKLELSGLGNLRLFALPLGTGAPNLAVKMEAFDSVPKIAGHPFHIPYSIHNFSRESREVRVTLEIDGTAVQNATVSVRPGASVAESFPYLPRRGGKRSGRILISDPEIPMDNEAFFSVTVAETVPLLLLSPGGEALDPFYYLRLALDPRPGEAVHGIRIRSAGFGEAEKTDLNAYRVIAVAPGGAHAPSMYPILAKYIQNGGTLLAFPENAGSDRFYRGLSEALALGNFYTGTTLRKERKGMSFEKPLNNLNELLDLSLLQWKQLALLTPENGKVLAKCDDLPLIREVSIGRGKVYPIAFSVRRTASNWPELKSFPIAMACLLNHAAGYTDNTIRVHCGETVRLTGKEISVLAQDGRTIRLSDGLWKDTWMPGIAAFSGTGTESAVLEPMLRESDPECLSPARIRLLFDTPMTVLKPEAELHAQITGFRRGTELSGILLFTALALTVLEFLTGMRLLGKPDENREENAS